MLCRNARLRTTCLVALAAALSSAGCRTSTGPGVDAGVNGNDGSPDAAGVVRPEPPEPCDGYACQTYCELVGAESGTCEATGCTCTGCVFEVCGGYCYWWEEGQTADIHACADGFCVCAGCDSNCVDTCRNARTYDARREEMWRMVWGACEGERCVCDCNAPECEAACDRLARLDWTCDGFDCRCLCTEAQCSGPCGDGGVYECAEPSTSVDSPQPECVCNEGG